MRKYSYREGFQYLLVTLQDHMDKLKIREIKAIDNTQTSMILIRNSLRILVCFQKDFLS